MKKKQCINKQNEYFLMFINNFFHFKKITFLQKVFMKDT